jgi:hypothetical protein
MTKDWRNDISGIDNLLDIDPAQLLVALRHNYLSAAKDMLDNESWDDMGEECCAVAETLHAALELQFKDLDHLRH